MNRLVECVPNFSEGRDRSVIDRITAAIAAVEGVSLLDVDMGADTNRTVVTFIGPPDAVEEAAFRSVDRAAELIDMRRHRGAHPRQGATDVVPFVPVADVSMEECVAMAHRVGRRVGEELRIPVWLYEEAATRPERASLADLRAGEYEALAAKLGKPEWAPDYGPAVMNERAGATVIGAREFLIAFNVNLNTRNHRKANAVAFDIRTKGRPVRDDLGRIVRDEAGQVVREPGTLKEVRAIGWFIEEFGRAQISMNLTNHRMTPPHIALEEARERARERGLVVTGSELVGLIPRAALIEAGKYYLRLQGTSPGQPEEEVVRTAVLSMGLAEVKPFDPAEKVVEYRAGQGLAGPLMRLTGREFLNELSTDSPAPGGGSVAALAGALGSSLATMVANLTSRNKAYAEVMAEMFDIAEKGQEVKDRLCSLVDEDTRAFNRMLDAIRRPKGTEEERLSRDAAVEDATKGATLVPLEVMRRSREALALARAVAERGMQASASDAGVGALMARAAAEGAWLNVRINAPNLRDRAFADECRSVSDSLLEEVRREAEGVLATVVAAIGGAA
jgi:glutamate formiminotransferase/formiminotetrahydrofolate cyclodeaminase